MAENLFEIKYDITKKSKIKQFYEKYKIFIIFIISFLIISFVSFSFYIENKENKKIKLSDNYIKAKLYLENGRLDDSTKLLQEIIFENDTTYSTLSFFVLIDENLISDKTEIKKLFNYLLENINYTKEMRNLLIFKKTLFISNFVEESELLQSINPLLNSGSEWNAHALMLLGDYFLSKNQNIKAIEFYQKIFTIKNLHNDIYNQATRQLLIISNE